MPSDAYSIHLSRLLLDASELDDAQSQLRVTNLGSPPKSAAMNRAAVVICVSAWESYLEELMRESVEVLRPPAPPLDSWPALQAYVLGLVGRFNTPSPDNVDRLVQNCLGLADVSRAWTWRNSTAPQAVQRLKDALDYRHQIAHGVNPRPLISRPYASPLPGFFRKLARCTDDAVRSHLVGTLGIAAPWPP